MAAYCANKKHADTEKSKNPEEIECYLEKDAEPGDASKGLQEDKEGGSAAGAVIGIIGALAVVGGLVYCWKTKKCCFGEKNEDFKEGGEDKKEFQRNAKVSLVDN